MNDGNNKSKLINGYFLFIATFLSPKFCNHENFPKKKFVNDIFFFSPFFIFYFYFLFLFLSPVISNDWQIHIYIRDASSTKKGIRKVGEMRASFVMFSCLFVSHNI